MKILILYDFGFEGDYSPVNIIRKTKWSDIELDKLQFLQDVLEDLKGVKFDAKIKTTLEITKKWLKEKHNPIIFCRYIETAKYVGEILKEAFKSKKNIDIQVITSEDPDEVRRERIEAMAKYEQRILVCTDCLSEGINLQDSFTALLHYDLPWNPNRLEQREGRIDRYGQTAATVKTYLLYGKENPIDGVLLKVLLRKVQEIRKSIGISLPFPEDSKTLLDSIFETIIRKAKDIKANREEYQLELFQDEDLQQSELKATKAIEKAADREKTSRSIFAQNAIKPFEIEADLKMANEAIGNPEDVEKFVIDSLREIFTIQIIKDTQGYTLFLNNLPAQLRSTLPNTDELKITFYSPVPNNYTYIGRNHPFVEQLSQKLIDLSATKNKYQVSRSSVIKSKLVDIKHTLLLFRVRNVIENKSNKNQVVAEEMLSWGYKGDPDNQNYITHEDAKKLLFDVKATTSLSQQAKENHISRELENYQRFKRTKNFR